ncbi:diacylglycerol/lipid kinase family protein [Paracraurococcus lichenis]|uniref:Diacylglycerol kinase family protein n=1 Tax=Paracraurococcus lichenis TaxID=3064888 RepID=A0ABT9DYP8_9PROT|nr:diacylglycerol kinase family protein [Paracraurococcus sp. LOR1-02]MDO9709008.1 diacylglycerol kinase family protein [Paracraurococcus sp. LOR1-02]
MRRVAVVINARSGGLLGRERAAEEVAEHLAATGLEAVIIHEAEEPELCARLDRAVAAGADAVVVGGGDGSIAAAAQRLAGTGIALGILPCGTMNMLARDLAIPLDLEEASAVLARGEVRAIDVAEVNGHAFLCMSVLGLPTALGRHRERQRGGGIGARLRLALGALRTLWRYRPMGLDIALDGGAPQPLRARAFAVTNNAYAEGFGALFMRERLDRGELVLYRARHFGAWWIVRMLAAMALGAWRRRPEIEERAARQVAIGSRRRTLRVMNDGEALLLEPPLRYAIRPGALRVIVPSAPAEQGLPETAALQVPA